MAVLLALRAQITRREYHVKSRGRAGSMRSVWWQYAYNNLRYAASRWSCPTNCSCAPNATGPSPGSMLHELRKRAQIGG
jgi:hypothetical protein